MSTSGRGSIGNPGISSARLAWPCSTSVLRLRSLSSLSTAFQGASMLGLANLVQLCPLGLFEMGMFSEQNVEHWPGSVEGGTWEYSAIWNAPWGPDIPYRMLAWTLLITRLNPAIFHWLWTSCSISSRRLLPA